MPTHPSLKQPLASPTTNPVIVYEDDHLLVIDKPANMLSVPGRGPDKQDCAIARIQQSHPQALIVHRLDYATSGLLVVALSKAVHRSLSKLFEVRAIQKRYCATVDGQVAQDHGEITLPLICDWPNRPLQKVDFAQGKPACTQYRVLSRDAHADTSRVALTPITGRSHQLRVHMQQIGHPIVGDEFYAPPAAFNKAPRLLLHAEYLAFEHPVTNRTLTLDSPPPF
ncbi:pseudouridine synthase [Simiduia sp. 21SJ11W-1]|uniref:pseudouridine synthase n=1 Tax=Simiduia sp. 21SJ11W-1 TaxID=2909669 RepID=UPI0020A0AF42|nr:pseudouridine synthase [Simiduia sp. 21SJ11W-1]UTA46339.1 pseudouridine synthase [Simiduia sp. 21SJ11W-1]